MKKRANWVAAVTLTMGLMVLCGPARATEYYVDKDNGSDDSNGLTLPAAFATIAKAMTVISGGDSVYIAQAQTPYYEPINLANTNCSGTPEQYTKICGLPDQRPIISGLGYSTDQGKIINLKDKVFIEICNLEVESNDYCIGMGHYGGGADNCRIHNNIFRSISGLRVGMGIQLHDGTFDNLVYNNIFYNLDVGTLLAHGSNVNGNRIINNLFYNCNKGVAFYEAVRPALNLIANNIAADCEVGFYGNGPMEDGPLYNNCVFNNIVDFQGVNLEPSDTVIADPLFVDANDCDFHLQADSPCVDAGLDSGIGSDFDNNPRPYGSAYDIGPYEVLPQTPFDIAVSNITDAIREKERMLEEINDTLTKECEAYDALEELLESGDCGDLQKGDLIKAKQKIHSAIQHEEQAKAALERSIEKLWETLGVLGTAAPVGN